MSKTALSTRPVSSSEGILRDKFAESIVEQSTQMDKLGQQLITLELAIPGLYATVLKLIQGADATLPVNGWLYTAFGCWFVALLLTLVSLVPRRWQVDPSILRQESAQNKILGLEDFFFKSAQYKRRLLIPACLLVWLGIASAVLFIV